MSKPSCWGLWNLLGTLEKVITGFVLSRVTSLHTHKHNRGIFLSAVSPQSLQQLSIYLEGCCSLPGSICPVPWLGAALCCQPSP